MLTTQRVMRGAVISRRLGQNMQSRLSNPKPPNPVLEKLKAKLAATPPPQGWEVSAKNAFCWVLKTPHVLLHAGETVSTIRFSLAFYLHDGLEPEFKLIGLPTFSEKIPAAQKIKICKIWSEALKEPLGSALDFGGSRGMFIGFGSGYSGSEASPCNHYFDIGYRNASVDNLMHLALQLLGRFLQHETFTDYQKLTEHAARI